MAEKQFEGQLTPRENFERKEMLHRPLHDFEIYPAAICPICRWPEELYQPGIDMWANRGGERPRDPYPEDKENK